MDEERKEKLFTEEHIDPTVDTTTEKYKKAKAFLDKYFNETNDKELTTVDLQWEFICSTAIVFPRVKASYCYFVNEGVKKQADLYRSTEKSIEAITKKNAVRGEN